MGNKARALQIAMAAWPHDYRCHEIIRHCTKDD
jgi:hypothetical protein